MIFVHNSLGLHNQSHATIWDFRAQNSTDFEPMQKKTEANFKDLCRVKAGFKSVPLQFYFEIAGLAIAKKWREIQNMAGEERF